MSTDKSFKCTEQKHLGVGPGIEPAPKESCRVQRITSRN